MGGNSLIAHPKILEPLSKNNGSGEWLRYDPIYTKIRNAKREDNDGMSREIWEGEIKQANWQEVENLTLKALESQSKDLQLICWLIEARLHLYGIDTLPENIALLLSFLQKFWDSCYPPKEEGTNQEFRVHILESFLRAITQITITEPLKELTPKLGAPINLAQCYESDNLERMSKKGGDAASFYQKSLTNGLITIDRIRNAFSDIKKEDGEKKIANLISSIKSLKAIDEFIDKKTNNSSPNFGQLIAHLEEIERLYNLAQKVTPLKREENKEIETSPEVTRDKKDTDRKIINDRAEVYQAIRQLSDFLLTLEPHSPSPTLLKLIGGWENKTLPQILRELQSSQPEIRSLLRLLAGTSGQENPAFSPPQPEKASTLSGFAPE